MLGYLAPSLHLCNKVHGNRPVLKVKGLPPEIVERPKWPPKFSPAENNGRCNDELRGAQGRWRQTTLRCNHQNGDAVAARADQSNPAALTLSNAEIADRLASLAQLLSSQKENPYKVKAYQRAAAQSK
jgi:hypothetical protein